MKKEIEEIVKSNLLPEIKEGCFIGFIGLPSTISRLLQLFEREVASARKEAIEECIEMIEECRNTGETNQPDFYDDEIEAVIQKLER